MISITGLITSCAPLYLDTEEDFLLSENAGGLSAPENPTDFDAVFYRAGCENFRSYVWNYIYNLASRPPDKLLPYHTIKENLAKKVEGLIPDSSYSAQDVNEFAMGFVQIYALVTEFMNNNKTEETYQALVQFEHGLVQKDHETFARELEQALAQLDLLAKKLKNHCAEEPASPQPVKNSTLNKKSVPWFFAMKRKLNPLVYGARKVMASAYQHCTVLDLPLMNRRWKTKGVKVQARHPSQTGKLRIISDLNKVNRTHYYLSQIEPIQASQCVNVKQSPLLYDFGGKPAMSKSSINLFENAGSGSKMLGLDCSGFTATAMASAGLRLKQKKTIRPVHVKNFSSWMFKNLPQDSLSCLTKEDISPNNPLQPGDMLASNTHIAIVEMTDDLQDSFGLNRLKRVEQCRTEKIKTRYFNFSIIQSSAHNNSVGINRMHIAESLPYMSNDFKIGLKKTASSACYKMFGAKPPVQGKEISVLRHKTGTPACRDREFYLEKQECLRNCEPLSVRL